MAPAPTTPKAYIDALPEDRRAAMRKLRAAVNKGLPKGYQEGMQYGMPAWFVPHRLYPDGYHCDPKQPVPFASIASQKRHMALYLFCIYTDPKESARFAKAWKARGHKLDMGKSCVRFRSIEDVPLDLVTETVARIPVEAFLAAYEKQIPASKRKTAGTKTAKKKAAKKKAATKKAATKKAAKTKAARTKAAPSRARRR